MKNFSLYLLLMLLFILSISCGRIKPKPPEPTELDTLLAVSQSTLMIPIHYEVSQLEETVNTSVTGTFIREWIKLNDKGDSLYLEVTKSNRIELSWQGKTLTYSFPVKVSGKFIKSVGKIKVKNTEPIEMEMVLHLATQLGFDRDWNLAPQSKLERIQWLKDPRLKMGFFKINLRKFVENALEKNKDKLIPKLDEALSKLLKTRNTISKIWNDIQKPIRINKKETEIWLKAYAEDMRAKLSDDDPEVITLKVELKARLQLIIEGQIMPPSNDKLPPFHSKEDNNDSLRIFILARIPYKKVNEILARELEGKNLSAEGYSTTIKKIKLYGTDDGLAVDLKVSGDVSGRIYARGTLHYDSLTSIISARDFHFDVDSENILINSADWLLHDNAIGLVSEKFKVDIKPYADMLPELIINGIEKGKTGEKLNLTIDNLTVVPIQHIYTQKDIQFIFEARGRAEIGLERRAFARKNGRKKHKLHL